MDFETRLLEKIKAEIKATHPKLEDEKILDMANRGVERIIDTTAKAALLSLSENEGRLIIDVEEIATDTPPGSYFVAKLHGQPEDKEPCWGTCPEEAIGCLMVKFKDHFSLDFNVKLLAKKG